MLADGIKLFDTTSLELLSNMETNDLRGDYKKTERAC